MCQRTMQDILVRRHFNYYICIIVILGLSDHRYCNSLTKPFIFAPDFSLTFFNIYVTGSNYFPYRPEVNLAFERDYKSYPEYAYDRANHYRHERTGWDYLSNTGIARPPTNFGAVGTGHRRQFSNISTSSNVNPGFHLESDELDSIYQLGKLNIEPNRTMGNRMHVYENVPQRKLSQNYPEYVNSGFGSSVLQADRPMSLPFDQNCGTKLRSSLKKYGTQTRPSAGSASAKNGGTPTNPTPADSGSLTSDDSSYLSAREGSISSQSRVRFSPDAVPEQPNLGPNTSDASAYQPINFRRMSRTRNSGGSDMLSPSTHS